MANKSRTKFDNMKNEIANSLGINLTDPTLTARNAGLVGGNIVKRVFEQQTGNNYPVKKA